MSNKPSDTEQPVPVSGRNFTTSMTTVTAPTGQRLLVCGGRDYNDGDHIWNTLTAINSKKPIATIIHGAARGADSQAMYWAQMMGIKHAPFVAEWQKHGKAAGAIRNQRMLDEGRPDFVLAFPGGNGTADMVRRAKKAGIPTQEYYDV